METEEYFQNISDKTEKLYEIAREARSQNKDPEDDVDIPVATDLPEKASSLVIAAMFPELENQGVAERLRELEDEFGKNDERVAFQIAREIAEGKFYNFEDRERACDAGVRVGVSYMTGGITTAPLEGIGDVKIRENNDGSKYLAVYYSGPIRSAGGTASAMSVLIADYVRIGVDLDEFKPSETVIKRYATEVEDYYNRVTAKQYNPTREETEFIAKNVPVEVTGSPTESLDVSNYKDLDRVETNRIRGGMCLVYLDGLPLKASKIKKRIEKWGSDFGLEHWEWVKEYLELQKSIHASGDSEDEEEESSKDKKEYTASDKYLGSLTAGRPVFAHPGRKGGFRLRYGHSRTNGLAAVSFHPATMEVSERFIATGTQLKTEYPMKGTVGTPCDTIHPPVVRLESGEVLKVESREQARDLENKIDEILFLGDMLVPYGEFVENGKKLLPSPYVREWWEKELEKELERQDVKLGRDFSNRDPTPEEAFKISDVLGIPLYPGWTYHWRDTSPEKFKKLYEELRKGEISSKKAKKCLEDILVPHKIENDKAKINEDHKTVLNTLMAVEEDNTNLLSAIEEKEDITEFIKQVSGYELKDQAPHYIGARMGRPEKAERRTIDGKPQILFPCGKEEGGRMRNLVASYNNKFHNQKGVINQQIIHNKCPECGEISHYSFCRDCNVKADPMYICSDCGKEYLEEKESCGSCGNDRLNRYKKTEINVREMMDEAMENLGMRHLPELLKSVRGMSSKNKNIEPIEKGLIRQKYDLYVNKDGTVRYDATDIPMTHFKPKEINVSVEKLKELGYTHDKEGKPLENEQQILELKPQDIVIPDGSKSLAASDYFVKVAKFVDELLEDFYGLEPYYDVDKKEDLIGSLVIGLAPHTSGGTVGRIIGFTNAKGIYAHPYWHAAKRRNCLPGDHKVLLQNGEHKALKELYDQGEKPKKSDKSGTLEKEIDVNVKSVNDNQKIVDSKAVKAYRRKAPDFKLKLIAEDGHELEIFPDHKMKLADGKKNGREIEKGDQLLIKEEESLLKKQIKKIEKISSEEKFMYDIEVEKTHNYITENNIVTSNCDGDEDAILLLMDGLLNFSRDFLPNMVGARTMDAPLILSTTLNPDEVDDEAWATETVSEYPLSFYEETLEYKEPWNLDTDIEIGEDVVHSDEPFCHSYTHETSDIEDGPVQSEYVTLNEMSEKTSAQLGLGKKTKAVDENMVAQLLLKKHFIPDIKGNLRAFSRQRMRCVDCNTKFRRVPLTNQTIAPSGKVTAQCPECDGKVLLTISEGTIKKYLEPSKEIIDNFEVDPYVRQQIIVLNKTIQSLFGKSNRQSGLKQFTA